MNQFKKWALAGIGLAVAACQSAPAYEKTVAKVELPRYLGKWYVIASRPTMFETDAYNATESYTQDPDSGKIAVDFRYRKGGFTGEVKTVPQTARMFNLDTNAHLKISLWWLPFELDYLIIALDPNYAWTAVGVPNRKYLWVMARQPQMAEPQLQKILADLKASGYPVDNVTRVPQQPEQ